MNSKQPQNDSVCCNSDTIIDELNKAGINPVITNGLKPVLEHTSHKTYYDNEVIFHEGSAIEFLYFISSGRIKLVDYLENGTARIVRLHKQGSLLGLNGL